MSGQQHAPAGKDPVPILQEAGWAPGPVWTGGKSRPHRVSVPGRPARSSVAIPIELPGPQETTERNFRNKLSWRQNVIAGRLRNKSGLTHGLNFPLKVSVSFLLDTLF